MSYNVTKVTKRNGQLEEFDVAKITKVINFAARDLDVSVSQIELNAKIQLFNGVHTSDIHDTLIKSAADLISEENPDYQYMAARLAIYQMRKQAYGDYNPPHLLDHVKNLVEKKRYTPDLLDQYSEEEYNELNDYLDHDRDNNIAYAGVKQIIGKYAVKDKAKETQWVLETPQMIFMLVGMCLFSDYDKKYNKTERMKRVKTFYDLVSTHKISLPTPIIAGVRTLTKQFSSCVKISTGDSLDSINASSNAIVKYISQRAGIGLNIGRIRAVGSVIRNGEATHTGIFPFVKLFESAVGSCNQGNVRGGAATLYYPVWHYEVETLLVLKNNKGTQDNRARNLDYAVQLNKHFYVKATSTDKEKRKYNLFSPSDVPGMYEAFFRDQAEFERLYDKYSADKSIRRRTVDAFELFSKICTERNFTGRIYIHNVDNTNTNSPFDTSELPIYMSNLCVSGETEVLIKQGNNKPFNRKIKYLDKKWVKVFNGKEFTEAYVSQTAPIAKLYHVLFEYQDINGNVYKRDGDNYIRATKEHIWYVKTDNGFEKTSTMYLKVGDEMEHCYVDENGQVQIGKAIVTKVVDYNVEESSYCLNEVTEHKAVFNGVLAGQCTEIALPTKDLKSPFDEEEGEIALCTLSAINVYDYVDETGNIDYEGLQLAVEYSVRSLDNLLDYQEYPFKQAKNATHARRSLGISITNLAAFLAKQKLRYESSEALVAVDKLMEAISFFAIRASVDLAKELGPCSGYKETLWSKGILPFHRANKNARALVGSRTLTFSDNNSVTEHFGTWEQLRQEMKEYGIRNSTLLTQAPTETSSQVINSTNGIEAPRMLVTSKISKDGKLKQVVPDIKKYGQHYTTLWSLSSNVDTINISAVMQTWVCQAISTNTNYDPVRFEGGVVQIKQIMSDILYAYKMGLKTLYYQNTRDHQKEKVELEVDSATETDDACASGACAI